MTNHDDTLDILPQRRRISFRGLQYKMSTWVIIGFTFWIGFFLGAVILHAMAR